MWLKHPHVSPSMWLSGAFSQRLHQAWKNKTTPTGKKDASIVPGSSCTSSSRGMVASELSAPQQRQLRARRPRSYCVGSHSAPQFLRPPSHTHMRQLVLFTAGSTSLSTPRNNFAESHGVIHIRLPGWLGRNTRRFLEPAMTDKRANQTWRWKGRGLGYWDETFTGFQALGHHNTVFIRVVSVYFLSQLRG